MAFWSNKAGDDKATGPVLVVEGLDVYYGRAHALQSVSLVIDKGVLGIVDPKTGKIERIALGEGSSPHGVITGPGDVAWLTDGGQNAIVSYDPKTKKVTVYKLPEARGYTNLNTAAFDRKGVLWFTGQNGIYGRLDPKTGKFREWKSVSAGAGPYGIAFGTDGRIWYNEAQSSLMVAFDPKTERMEIVALPTRGAVVRHMVSDPSRNQIWLALSGTGRIGKLDLGR